MRMRNFILSILLGILAVEATPRAQVTNPCRTGGVQVLTATTYRFALESPDHNATIPSQPGTFVITGYRNKWVVDVPPQNPQSRPVIQAVEVPRGQMTLVPDSNPACYISPPVTITPLTTANPVPTWSNLRSFAVGLTDGLGTSARESFSSEVSDPFVLGLLRGGAHRVLAP